MIRVTLTATPASVETGHWCDACLLPSTERIVALLELEGEPYEILTTERCAACGAVRRVG